MNAPGHIGERHRLGRATPKLVQQMDEDIDVRIGRQGSFDELLLPTFAMGQNDEAPRDKVRPVRAKNRDE